MYGKGKGDAEEEIQLNDTKRKAWQLALSILKQLKQQNKSVQHHIQTNNSDQQATSLSSLLKFYAKSTLFLNLAGLAIIFI